MKSFNKTFAEFSKEDFSEFSSRVFGVLRKNNKKYREILEEQKELKEKNPMLKTLFDEFHVNNKTILSKKDVYALREYLELFFQALDYEYYEMFLKGQKEEYFALKNKGIIK